MAINRRIAVRKSTLALAADGHFNEKTKKVTETSDGEDDISSEEERALKQT